MGERQRRLSHRGGKERSLEDKVGEGNQVMMRKGRRGLSGERCPHLLIHMILTLS